MSQVTFTLPTPGQTPNSTADPEINNALSAIQTWINGLNVDGGNVVASLTGRRLIQEGGGSISSGSSGAFSGEVFVMPSANQGIQGTPGGAFSAGPWLDPANFAVVGKNNTQLIVKLTVGSNGTQIGANITASLYPLTYSGGASALSITAGAAVTGSSVTINNPAINSSLQAETAAFTFPAAGSYLLGYTLSANLAANSALAINARLFVLNS